MLDLLTESLIEAHSADSRSLDVAVLTNWIIGDSERFRKHLYTQAK